MCYDYELKSRILREEMAREAQLKADAERNKKPQPAAPQTPPQDLEPLPV